MTDPNQAPNNCPPVPPLARIVDLRIPLPWLVMTMLAGLLFAFNLDRNVAQISKDYGQLQNNLATLNAKLESLERGMSASTSDLALQKFRLENLEAEMRALRELPALRTPAHPTGVHKP